ncbi:hypothetical protein [Pareuzebyella sediminis]|uniref:hypothetical protein n=1 Tax=Pareuzebyella sediminis TaxID=2607998 RepID=UPI0011F06A18|nr:hypothetical protein [Pareuzebyella sediminis]
MKMLSSTLLVLWTICTLGQGNLSLKPSDDRLRFGLNQDASHWIAFHTYAQLWARINENNPGSLLSEEPQEHTLDLSLRRFRLGFQAQLSDALRVYVQLGINNLNYLSPRGTSLDLLDAYAEYYFSEVISIGAGKTAWTGLSRFSAPNTSKLLGYDLLSLALPTADETDDLIRKLSIYAKGKLGKLDYRIVASKPFLPSKRNGFDGELIEGISKFQDKSNTLVYSAYVKWEFWDAEPNDIPFSNGSYLGKRKVLNIGIGHEYHGQALASMEDGAQRLHDMNLWAIDVFLDRPINRRNNTVFTAYAGYFNYGFGPNYLRNTGINNPIIDIDEPSASFNGPGNAYPVIGTGDSYFIQLGYAFPHMGATKNYGQLQPYVSVQYSDFERLKDPVLCYDLGLNWLLKGHLSKFSVNFQSRPIFTRDNEDIRYADRKWCVIAQYIIRLQ